MLQRIQSIYLFLIVLLGVTLFFVPVLQLVTPPDASVQRMWEMSALGLDETTPNMEMLMVSPVQLTGLWGLSVVTILIPLLAFVILCSFKKRIFQARLSIFLAMLCLGYYAILAMFGWFAVQNIGVEWHVMPWAAIPAVCFVLTLMAVRRILADEALVRSADRIR